MPRWAIVLLVVTGSLVVLVPVGLLAAYVYAYGENHKDMRFPSQDVTVTGCTLDPESRRPVAELGVTSQAQRRGTYTITLEFQDGQGAVVGSGTAVVEDLATGASERTVVVGANAGGSGAPQCVVADVDFEATKPVGTPS
ncbi:hypothetical protein J7E93_04670 [Streptomyces sp. ISL-36]|uniref:hypothetical protein n=1 Tax=Streptomyces sp. ISL-36 TaxID=2819182 RepID=UPI001BE6D74B|nr:hypothetical protein [Streptomyces sp. ISL-36]MBT2439426.1 hypothetical protein [Streptomyces sp. ISL-36]